MDLRASDADREQTVVALTRHHEDGRLTTDELEERIAAAWAAKYVSALATLTADLPDLTERRPEPARPGARRLPRMPGRLPFTARWRAPVAAQQAMTELLAHLAPPLHAHGYDLVDRTPDRARFARRSVPGWAILVAIFTFPVGLLALLARTEDHITIELVEEGGSTLLFAHGSGSLGIRRAFADLEG